jgi:hypothetical protein
MSKTSKLNIVIDNLGYKNGIVKKNVGKKIKFHPIKTNFAKQTFEILEDIEAIYFTGEYPLIYFKTLSDLNPQKIKLLHKSIWNQSRIPLMFIITPTEIRIYDCYKEPLLEQDTNINKLEVDRFTFAIDELKRMKNIYHQSNIDSGRYWETTSGRKINATKKVDQLLINNLKYARIQLLAELDLDADIALPIIHNLLCRSLFILYLEDRKVINGNYYSNYLPNTTSYFEILNDVKACYRLFKDLNNRFHGNLFIVNDDEKDNIEKKHLQKVRQCFYGDSIRRLQFSMWRMFDFSYIPIELVSSIYEEFLHTENNEDVISKDGAFYTPQSLAEFVLNEILPFPDENNKKYDLKILDPACGSGIFLVESFRRLIERWKYSNKNKRISANVLKSILLNSIYGVEKNSEAIKVASLSLYLTMLNYLEPKYIWKNVKFPQLIKSNHSKLGENLFKGDTFVIDDYKKHEYDLIVGNPPWKVKNIDINAKSYIKKNKLPTQIVAAFLHLLPKLFPDTKIALVSASKILFNNSKGYDKFRKFLFQESYVETIVNFAALRKVRGSIGRNLFSSAVGPACVIFYQYNKPETSKEFITYCTPKPDRKNKAVSELIIDSSDIKYIPRNLALNENVNIWKIAMYGTTRDYLLVESLTKGINLKEFSKEWIQECGFETSDPQDIINYDIQKLPFLDAKKVERYYSPKNNTAKITCTKFYRTGDLRIYNAPHILIKLGQKDKRFCVSFSDYNCSFRRAIYGIHNDNSDLLKAITVYLNSKLVTYLLFMSSASWGIEREQVHFIEVLSLTFFDFLQNKKAINFLNDKFDSIVKYKTKIFANSEYQIQKIEEQINQFLYENLNLTDEDIYLINNVVDYSLDFFNNGDKSISIKPTEIDDIKKYTKLLCSQLKDLLKSSDSNLWANIYSIDRSSPLCLISLHFNNKNSNKKVIYNDDININILLNNLNKFIYKKHSESIYFRKVIKFYRKDVIYIAKPNEKRFWTEAASLEDSNSIFLEIANNE